MAYADVNHPVVLSATRKTSFTLDNYLRRMCIVSLGDTSLNIGEYKLIDNTTYGNCVTAKSALEKRLTTFFSYAGNKPIVVLECGAINDTFEAQCNTIKSFLQSEELAVLNIIMPDEFYFTKKDDTTYSAILSETTLTPTATEQKLSLVLSNLTADDISFKNLDTAKVSIEKRDGEIYYKEVATLDANKTADVYATISGTEKKIGALTFNKTGESVKSQISFTEAILGTKDTSFVELATLYSTLDYGVFFFLNMPYSESTTSNNLGYLKGLKAVQLICANSAKENLHEASIVVGKTANSIFDISSSNPSSPLNYKAVSGFTALSTPIKRKNELVQAGISFIDEMAGNYVIKSGRQMDGTPWDYYYNYENSKYRLTNKIASLLLNGANNPVSAVKFNQDGVDTIHSVILAELNEQVSMGILTAYSQSYDSATSTLEGSGEITCPTYQEFVASNPDDYKNEIYSGISFYVQIGKFVRQVKINVNLGA